MPVDIILQTDHYCQPAMNVESGGLRMPQLRAQSNLCQVTSQPSPLDLDLDFMRDASRKSAVSCPFYMHCSSTSCFSISHTLRVLVRGKSCEPNTAMSTV